MRKWIALVVLILVTGCGEKGQEDIYPWPSSIQSISGFSAQREAEIESALLNLNEMMNTTVVYLTPQEKTFPISIEVLPAEKETASRMGLAEVSALSCKIGVSQKALNSNKNYLETVIKHEMGHCAGLSHNESNNQLMSAYALPYESYGTFAEENFIHDFLQSIGLSPPPAALIDFSLRSH